MASSKDLNPPPSGSYFQKFSTVTEIIQIKSRIYYFVLSPTAVYKLIIPAITCQSSLTKRQWITFKLKWQQHIEAELKRMSSRIGDQIRQNFFLKNTIHIWCKMLLEPNVTFSGRVSTSKRIRPKQSRRTKAIDKLNTRVGFLATHFPYFLSTNMFQQVKIHSAWNDV